VRRWTEKKEIDMFKKKFIFIPINQSLHWSQCIVVNPAAIIEHNKWHAVNFNEEKGNSDAPFPCIIFLDSLNVKPKAQVAKNVIAWLNAEWKRLGKSDDPALAPFNSNMKVFAPKSKHSHSTRLIIDVSPFVRVANTCYLSVPYQDNSWDCGVFVCRYAYAVYLLRERSFSYREANAFGERGNSRFLELITDSPEFSFAMPDIARFRNELKTLIEMLSGVYTPWKQEENRKEREEKRVAKKRKAKAPACPTTRKTRSFC
jgi:Ulp1 family protease